jgi:predicted nucleic acid-binding protein
MKIVVDTNIVFSAILNSSSNIGRILIHPHKEFEFYSCNFLKEEISWHKSKLSKLTRLSDENLDELINLCIKRIQFINHGILPNKDWNFAANLLVTLDLKDAPFLALSRHLKAKLWTGDKQLKKGLAKQGFQHYIIETPYLVNRMKKK